MSNSINEDIKVRKASSNDCRIIYKFVCDLEEQELEYGSFQKGYLSNLNDPYNVYLVAEYLSEVVGFVSCHSDILLRLSGKRVGTIQEFYVEPEIRNLGVGRTLLDNLKSVMRMKSIIQLEVSSYRHREHKHQFYVKEKFVETHKKFVYKVN
ncbi:MAG: GNAT family N-acetyltransferase [Ignavibacteriae bacterium HGW-Ignavibacteriae-4]|jgi:PhnO protein|nr:MAG: GNAT family N-acetyltransferase [Ignavibacteriae bacterium HGW-Ignavibacteriae-4]